jgi:hypothetical protein
MARFRSSSSATLANSPSKLKTNTPVSPSTCRMFVSAHSTAVPQ